MPEATTGDKNPTRDGVLLEELDEAGAWISFIPRCLIPLVLLFPIGFHFRG